MGIVSLEDKIVQQAVVAVPNAIYEEDFLGFSYGFRPGRSQHDALDALTVTLKGQKVNWILDADITAFVDEIDHEWMLMFLGHRIADRRLLGLICKWLQAGVMEDSRREAATKGTPQWLRTTLRLACPFSHRRDSSFPFSLYPPGAEPRGSWGSRRLGTLMALSHSE